MFHSYGDIAIAGEGLKIFIYARHSWALSSEGSLACHTYCDKGHLFIRAVYWGIFFDTIRYNTLSCDIRFIGWTICLNIFGEKDQNCPRTVICVVNLAD